MGLDPAPTEADMLAQPVGRKPVRPKWHKCLCDKHFIVKGLQKSHWPDCGLQFYLDIERWMPM